MKVFFDTNILICAVDTSDASRQERAIACIAKAIQDDTVFISTQVLQEFFSITTRKLRPALSFAEAARQVTHLCEFEVLGSSAASIQHATQLAMAHRLQWWDALILEAALRANADVLYSEDGQHGQRYGALTVVNPLIT
jgi:predicted nucleic acid-binding protein